MMVTLIKQPNVGIQKVFSSITIIALLFLGITLTIYALSIQDKILREDLKKRGTLLVESLAQSSALSIIRNDMRQLRALVRSAAGDEEILYIEIYNIRLDLIAQSGKGTPAQVSDMQKIASENNVYIEPDTKKMYDIYCPIMIKGISDAESKKILFGSLSESHVNVVERQIGIVRIGISTKYAWQKISGIAVRSIIITLCVVFCVVLFIHYFVSMNILEPLRRLTLAAVTISHGDLRHEVDIDTRNEIGVLARAFNLMVHDLRSFRDKLDQATAQIDDKVKEKTIELQNEIHRTAEKNSVLHERLKNISHHLNMIFKELRSPINAIQGFAETMGREEVQENRKKIKEYMAIIKSETVRITRAIDNLHFLSSFSLDEVNIHASLVDIQKVIAQSIACVEEYFPRSRIIFHPFDSLLSLSGEERQIVHAIKELIINAVYFSVESQPIEISAQCVDHVISIEIRDHGSGISPGEMEKVFEAFYRTEQAVQRYAGSGLGLTVSKKIIEVHGGTIQISNAQDTGLVAHIEFPEYKGKGSNLS